MSTRAYSILLACVLMPGCSRQTHIAAPPPGIVLPAQTKANSPPGTLAPVQPPASASGPVKKSAIQLPIVKAPAAKETRLREGKRFVPTYAYDVIVPVDPKTGEVVPDETHRNLDHTGLVLNCPLEMKLGVAEKVSFSITGDVDSLPGSTVDAELISDDDGAFIVTAVQEARVWSVTPKRVGRHALTLKVALTARLDGVDRHKTFEPVSRSVVVTSNAARVLGHWAWAFIPGSILIAFLVWMRHRSAQ